jgi:ABC-type ATPase involved in cell division
VVLKVAGAEYWDEMRAGFQNAASESGVQVVFAAGASEGDSAGQFARAQALFEGGIDALCLSPITSATLLPLVKSAIDRGIPVINVDDAELSYGATTILSADQEGIGSAAATFLKAALTPGATATMVGGLPGSSAAHARRKGFFHELGAPSSTTQSAASPRRDEGKSQVALRVESLCTSGLLRDVTFEAHFGEILGIAGLVGAGRTELVRAIFGADPRESGRVFVAGKLASISHPRDAIRLGIGLVPEDRKSQGLVLGMPVANNCTLTILDRISRFGVLRLGNRKTVADEYVGKLSIKTPSIKQTVRYLSGGNQQKVVISKWLASSTRRGPAKRKSCTPPLAWQHRLPERLCSPLPRDANAGTVARSPAWGHLPRHR